MRIAMMKTLPLFVVVAAFSISAGAQSASVDASSSASAPGHAQVSQTTQAATSRNGVSASSDTTAGAGKASASAAQNSSVSAELTRKVDSKDAKVGDAVEAKTTSETQLADGTKLPKGTRLVGHVTEASAKSATDKTSRLAFGFDHAVLRDGREVPIHSTLTSLSAPAPVSAGAGFGDDTAASDGGMMASRAGGGVRSGGGSLLGGAGGAVRGGSSLAGDTVQSAAVTTRNAGATANDKVDETAHAGTRGLSATTNAAGATSAHAASIPVGNLQGVSFRGASDAQSAATLEGTGKNIHLDSGSSMTLAVSGSH
jgi:hypothetical protein